MAMKLERLMCILVGAATAIGWALKCFCQEFNLTPLVSLPRFKIVSPSNLPYVPKTRSKIASISMSKDEDTLYSVSDNPPTYREFMGIQWGPWYVKPRTLHWWHQFFNMIMVNDVKRFREMFRMSVPTFQYICLLVERDLQTNPLFGLDKLPNRKLEVTKQVAIAIRRLATGNSLLSIGELFGIGKSTVTEVTTRFIKSLNLRGQHHLTWPVGEQLKKVKAGFESKWRIPQVCGAIDVTHVEVNLPGNERSTDYYDKDKNYSFILQAIVDAKTRFLNIFANYPGVVHDARVFANSGIKAAIDRGQCLNGPMRLIQGIPIPELLIGNAGYTQETYMLIPLPGYKLDPMSDQFNFKHSSTRMAVERSFGILKGVWQILKRPMYVPNCSMVSSIIHTTCILHNILLDKGDTPDDDLSLARHHDEGYR